MEKVALVGALLLQQVSEEPFVLICNSSGFRATVNVVFFIFHIVVIV